MDAAQKQVSPWAFAQAGMTRLQDFLAKENGHGFRHAL
jgi:hypothetical protein